MSMRLLTQRPYEWKRRFGATLTAASLLLPWLPMPTAAAAPLTCSSAVPWASYLTRATANTSGLDPDGNSAYPVMSRDGQKVVFSSQATDLVTGDTNGAADIFQFDRVGKSVKRLSLGPSSVESDDDSLYPVTNADARFTAFLTSATNLVSGDANGVDDIIVGDVMTGTSLASVSTAGTQADQAALKGPAMSATGDVLVFPSTATNLVTGDTNGKADIFLRNRATNTTTLISKGLSNAPADNDSTAASVSPDGRWVAFESKATNIVSGDTNGLADVFLQDTANGATTMISVDSQGHGGNGDSSISPVGAVSSNGNYIVFTSKADSLVAGDSNGRSDVFLYSRQTGTIKRVSISDAGTEANGDSWGAVISGNGLFVTFTSTADNLTPGVQPGTTNVYRYDITQRRIALVNATRFGTAGNQDADSPSISDDGRYVAFVSAATDLVPNKSKSNIAEVFVRDMMSPSFPLPLTDVIASGTSVALNYGRVLQRTSVPSACDFVIKVNGSARTVTNVQVFASTVGLTISPGISPTDTVTVDYDPGAAPIQDTLQIAAQGFTGQLATNTTRAVNVRTAVVTGADLVLTFDADLDTSSQPIPGDFVVNEDSGTVAVKAVSMDSRRLRLTLSAPVATGSYVTVSYNPAAGSPPLQSQAGGLISHFAGQSVTNQTAAITLESATGINAKINLAFSLNLDPKSVPDAKDFGIKINGAGAIQPTSVTLVSRTVTLTLPKVLQESDVVVLDYTSGSKPLQTPTWSPVGNLVSIPVANSSQAPDILAPTVNANILQFSLNRRIDTASIPTAADFTVKVGGTKNDVVSVTLDSIRVTLKLTTPVQPGESVTLAYTPTASSIPLQDSVGSRVAAVSLPIDVRNNTPAPALRSATVVADSLTMNFTRTLDTTSVPATGDFTVKANGTQIAVSAVVISGMTVKASLSGAVQMGEKVSVSYTPGATKKLKDQAGSLAPGFTDRDVQNQTLAPQVTQARVTAGQVMLNFSRVLDTSSTPAGSAFAVKVNGASQTPTAVKIAGTTVTLTLGTPALPGDTVLISYVPGTNALQDLSHSRAAAFTDRTVTNNTTPLFVSAKVQGAELTLTFNTSLRSTSVPAAADFTVKANGSTVAVSKVAISGRSVVLTLATGAKEGEIVTLTYTKGSTAISDLTNNPSANLTGVSVTNQTVTPKLSSATVNTKTLYLSFNRSLDTTSKPAPSDFAVQVTSGGSTVTATVTAVTVAGGRVTLTLGTTVKKGDLVVLTYTPGPTPLRDVQKTSVPAQTNVPVANLSTK